MTDSQSLGRGFDSADGSSDSVVTEADDGSYCDVNEGFGVADDGSVCGLENDYATFSKRGEQDLWGQHLQNLIRSRLGDAALALVSWEYHTNGDDLARVNVEPADFPILERKGDEEVFWQRTPVSTVAVTDPMDRDRIIARRWGR